jgi:hypothetical protein
VERAGKRRKGARIDPTLTVHRLHVPLQLCKTLASTNVIESAFSVVGQVCSNVSDGMAVWEPDSGIRRSCSITSGTAPQTICHWRAGTHENSRAALDRKPPVGG